MGWIKWLLKIEEIEEENEKIRELYRPITLNLNFVSDRIPKEKTREEIIAIELEKYYNSKIAEALAKYREEEKLEDQRELLLRVGK